MSTGRSFRRDGARSTTRARVLPPFAMVVVAIALALGAFAPGGEARAATCTTSLVNVVAHEDDDLLFQSPDLVHAIQSGQCVCTVFVTAGDAGQGQGYWSSREAGSRAAYAQMAGVANSWTQADAGIPSHPAPRFTLAGAPTVSLVFMRLPDGAPDGAGFTADGKESLQKLWSGSISTVHAVDGTSSYTKTSLVGAIAALFSSLQPAQIHAMDYVGSFGDGDHSDHHGSAYFARAAHQQYTTAHTFTGYMGYGTGSKPANVSGADLTAKQNAFFAYAPFDGSVCGSVTACAGSAYAVWLERQYTVGSESGGSTGSINHPPVADAGSNQKVVTRSTVQLDGTDSFDPDGNAITFKWTQTGGPFVSLSSPTSAMPTFVAPSSPTFLTFRLVVNDGKVDSAPSFVTITVRRRGGN